MAVSAITGCPKCLDKDYSYNYLLEKNINLQRMIDSMKLWLRNIPLDWQESPETTMVNLHCAENSMNQDLKQGSAKTSEELEKSIVLGELVGAFDKTLENENTYGMLDICPEVPEKQCDVGKGDYTNHHSKRGEISYPCDKCEYSTTKQCSLNRHKASKHENIRYPCDQCNYAATLACDLKRHKECMHEGISYPCDQCQYAAPSTGALNKHKQSKHEVVKHPLCAFSPTDPGSLKKHKKSMHEGLKYSCDKCEYSGSNESNLKKHKQKRHQDYDFFFF